MARLSTEVCTTSGSSPESRINSPPRRASASPLALRSTSTQPVNRFLAFHSLSPCRKSTSVPTSLMTSSSRTESLRHHRAGDVRMRNRGTHYGETTPAEPVLGAVGGHTDQPGRWVRHHLPGDLPHYPARLQRVRGGPGDRPVRRRRRD